MVRCDHGRHVRKVLRGKGFSTFTPPLIDVCIELLLHVGREQAVIDGREQECGIVQGHMQETQWAEECLPHLTTCEVPLLTGLQHPGPFIDLQIALHLRKGLAWVGHGPVSHVWEAGVRGRVQG